MMLNKVKIMTLIAAIFAVIRTFFPNFGLPDGLEEAIGVVVMFIAGFFVRETESTVAKLDVKR